jgi:hypothetical protein
MQQPNATQKNDRLFDEGFFGALRIAPFIPRLVGKSGDWHARPRRFTLFVCIGFGIPILAMVESPT